MKNIKIKICGMTDLGNVEEACLLQPDFIGFILYERSPRYVSIIKAIELVKKVPPAVRKAGVLVNEPLDHALEIAKSGIFDMLQLHGNEDADYCRKLAKQVQIIKAFHVSETLPSNLEDYQPFCEMFLFDTSGKDFGGSGRKFDHSILHTYKRNKEYILSGGISSIDMYTLKSGNYPKMSGVDLNSRFEIKPGIKNISLLKKFIENLRKDDND